MTRWTDDDFDDEEDEDYEDADDDAPDDEDEPTVSCPHCGREILEDLVRCPYCENYLSRDNAPTARKPWWLVLGVALCLYLVYRWIIFPVLCP